MNSNQKYLIDLLVASLFLTEPPTPDNSVDWDFLISKCGEQNIAGLVASAVCRLPDELKPVNYPIWLATYIDTLQTMAHRNMEFERMLALMNEVGITPICVKGCVTRKLYPDENLRTMSDFDIWVSPESLPKLNQQFTSRGFQILKLDLLEKFQKDDIQFECFSSLAQDFPQNTKYWENLFWQNTCVNDNGIRVT